MVIWLINWGMFTAFAIFVGVIFVRMYLGHRKRKARDRRMMQFRAWVHQPRTAAELKEVEPYLLKVLSNPHTDYHGPWEA